MSGGAVREELGLVGLCMCLFRENGSGDASIDFEVTAVKNLYPFETLA